MLLFLYVYKHTFHISQSQKSQCCYYTKPLAYYFHVKTKISVNFQICITCFSVTISGDFERFQYFLNLKQVFWKTKTFLKKKFHFLVQSSTNESATFPCKTALQIIASVKTNGMGSTKGTYHEEWNFATGYFIFSKFNLSIRTSYKCLV